MNDHPHEEREIISARVFAAPPEAVFAAFADPRQLARWWGPAGFTNTFHEFDLRPGGRWRLTMRGPDGGEFSMLKTFTAVAPPRRVEFVHEDPVHRFVMTLRFDPDGAGTRLEWRMLFDSAAECARCRGFIVPANEENFDRLENHLQSPTPSAMSPDDHAPTAAAAGREMILTRVLDAPRALVWEAWTNPAHVAQWWGPNGFTTTIEKMDVRPGGEWVHVMHGPDGARYPNRSVFREVVKPARLVFVHTGVRADDGAEASFEATWTFEELPGGRTRVTLRGVFPSAEALQHAIREFGALEGGKQTLARYGAHVATLAARR